MKLDLRQITHWCSAEFEGAGADGPAVTGYSIDSRTIGVGELFFAVKGERFDGHDFVGAAISRGAAAGTACSVANESPEAALRCSKRGAGSGASLGEVGFMGRGRGIIV